MLRKGGGRGGLSISKEHRCIVKMIGRLYKKAQGKTDYSGKKQYKQYKHQQNRNYKKTKTRRKTTVWIFQVTNKRNITQENLDMAKKGKPQERN